VVIDGGISAPTVTIYYGDEDSGKNEGSWDSSVTLPGTQSGNFFTSVTGLLPATTYHFGAKGDNAGGSKWAKETETFARFHGFEFGGTEYRSKFGHPRHGGHLDRR
jgi:hypothetical protein